MHLKLGVPTNKVQLLWLKRVANLTRVAEED